MSSVADAPRAARFAIFSAASLPAATRSCLVTFPVPQLVRRIGTSCSSSLAITWTRNCFGYSCIAPKTDATFPQPSPCAMIASMPAVFATHSSGCISPPRASISRAVLPSGELAGFMFTVSSRVLKVARSSLPAWRARPAVTSMLYTLSLWEAIRHSARIRSSSDIPVVSITRSVVA